MGEVWRAEDTDLGREVAIKVLPEGFTEDPERLARFEREAQLLASLNHPNIAGIHEIGTVDDSATRFLALELVEGPTLDERLAQGAMPLEEAVEMARQIAEALEEAHEKGIIHRDLKPQNIKLSPEGRVKVLDFGLAKAMDPMGGASGSGPDLTQSPTMTLGATVEGVILGTASYMAPEQAKGLPVDKRADIWAFGVVLYEMLTGERLFAGETVPETLAFVMTREPDLTTLPVGTPRGLRALLERCLERDPKQRLRDIGEARVALDRVDEVEESEQSAAEASQGPAGARWQMVVAVGLIGALVGGLVGRMLAPAGALPAPLRKLDMSAENIVVDWFTRPTLSPDGSRIVYISAGAVWVRELDRLDARQVATVSNASALVWSPDSREVVYADAKKLWRVDIDGGRPVAIADLPGSGSTVGVTWSEDGRIAVAVWRGAMYEVPAEGGRPVEMFPHDPELEIDYHAPVWLPDGRLLFAAHMNLDNSPSGDGTSERVDESDGEVLNVFDGSERRVVDWGGPMNIGGTYWDAESGLLLFSRWGPSNDIWARPMDSETFQPTGPELMLIPDAAGLSVADDGSLLYMEGSSLRGTRELIVADRTGVPISTLGQALEGLSSPALSPDGKRVAITARGDSSRDVWIFDLERNTSSRLTFEDSDESSPRWDADSERVIYSEIRGITSTIVARPADGSGARTVLVDGAGYGLADGIAMLSPDGRHLLFAEDVRGPEYLRLADFDTSGKLSEPRPFFASDDEPSVHDAHISPDGRFLAYMSTESGQPEIFLTRFPDGTGRWQVSQAGGRQPRWAAASGELFFLAGSGPSERAMSVVRVDDTAGVAVSAPEELFSLDRVGSDGVAAGLTYLGTEGGYDVSPDGTRFFMVSQGLREGAAAPRMVLVQNWRRLLEER